MTYIDIVDLPTGLGLGEVGIFFDVKELDGSVRRYTWTKELEWMVETYLPGGESPDSTDDVLHEADRVINGERQIQYGDHEQSFGRIAGLWTAYLGHHLSTLDVANLMILLKVSRTKGKFLRDSYVDICGYAALAEKLGTP